MDPDTMGIPADEPQAHEASGPFDSSINDLSDDEFDTLVRDVKEGGREEPMLYFNGEPLWDWREPPATSEPTDLEDPWSFDDMGAEDFEALLTAAREGDVTSLRGLVKRHPGMAEYLPVAR